MQARGVGTTEPVSRDLVMSDEDFQRIRDYIRRRAGISLAEHKREMAYSRLAKRLRALGLARFDSYLALLERADAEEWEYFVNALTTNLTAFFREPAHFPLLADHVRGLGRPPRIWCCASSTGEEPLSIAMTLCETLGESAARSRLLATDIDTQALERARAGVYPLAAAQAMGEARLRRFFLRGTGERSGWAKARPELLGMIEYRRLNLMDPQWGIDEGFDAIFCRNIMIYFDREAQTRLLERFAQRLVPGGLFFAGHSENFSRQTQALRLTRNTIYQRVAP